MASYTFNEVVFVNRENMTKWYKLEEKVPEHEQHVLIYVTEGSNSQYCVVEYLTDNGVKNKFIENSMSSLLVDKMPPSPFGGKFCSLEIPGFILNNDNIWWSELPSFPAN